MYVCICCAVTDVQIHAAVDDGAVTLEAVREVTGAGAGCGTCHESIEDAVALRCLSCPLVKV